MTVLQSQDWSLWERILLIHAYYYVALVVAEDHDA